MPVLVLRNPVRKGSLNSAAGTLSSSLADPHHFAGTVRLASPFSRLARGQAMQPQSIHSEYATRTLRGVRLLQAKLFSGRQHCDRFANALFARFQSFRCVNPNDEVTSVGGASSRKNSHALEF